MNNSMIKQTSISQKQNNLQTWALTSFRQVSTATMHELAHLSEGFEPISLKEMDSVALLNRTDTKFVISSEQLILALTAVQDQYRILSVEGQRLNHYRTLYFDTADFTLYNLHVNDRAERYKVRSREYTDTALSFLEVKHKTRKGRTIKSRISTKEPVEQITYKTCNWLDGVLPYNSRELEPKLWNSFTRITLVSKQCCERVTLDVNLSFFTDSKINQLDGVAIAEIKMDSNNRASAFLAQMRTQKIHPQGFSKYCIGVAMLYPQVKKNTLKPKMLWIGKMTRGVFQYE
jgi:hypothetical protein